MAGSVPVAKQRGSEQNIMLHLDDEIAGLVEAADMPAAQAGAHTTKPEPASPVAGELPGVHSSLATANFADFTVAWLCCAVQCSM